MGGKTLYSNSQYKSPKMLRMEKNERFKKIQKIQEKKQQKKQKIQKKLVVDKSDSESFEEFVNGTN